MKKLQKVTTSETLTTSSPKVTKNLTKKVTTSPEVTTKTEVISPEKKVRMKNPENPRLLKIIKDREFVFKGLKIGDKVKSETFSRNKFLGKGILVGEIIEFHSFPNKSDHSMAVKLRDEDGAICYRVVSRLIKDDSITKSVKLEK